MDQKTIYPEVRRPITRRLDIMEDVSGELDALKDELDEALGLGQPLDYSNPAHAARIVFEILGIRPRATAGVRPPTKPTDEPGPTASGYGGPLTSSGPSKPRARSLVRPHARRNLRREPNHRRTGTVYFPLSQPRFAPIDFDAELPELPFADVTPSELPLEQLVFYRDEHPLIAKLCRYQSLWRGRLAFVTSERYH